MFYLREIILAKDFKIKMIIVSRRFCRLKQINLDKKNKSSAKSAAIILNLREILAKDYKIKMIIVSRRFCRLKQIKFGLKK